jgi:hypothetical protein
MRHRRIFLPIRRIQDVSESEEAGPRQAGSEPRRLPRREGEKGKGQGFALPFLASVPWIADPGDGSEGPPQKALWSAEAGHTVLREMFEPFRSG